MDVKNAYLNVLLDEEIYAELREGYKGKNGNYIWKP